MILRGHQRMLGIDKLRRRGIPWSEIEFILDHKSIVKMNEQELLRHGCPPEGWADLLTSAIFTINAWRHEKKSWALILCGPTGSGKTFASSWAVAMDEWVHSANMQALGFHPKDPAFQPCMVNERELAMCRDEERIHRYATCSFLAIDDVAAESEPLRGFMIDRIVRVLYRRYDAFLPTLLTTNASVYTGADKLTDAFTDSGESILQRYGFRMASRLTAHGQSPVRWCGDAIDYRNDVHTHELRMSYEVWKEAVLVEEECIDSPQPEYASPETRMRVNQMVEELLQRIQFNPQNIH